MEEKITTAVTIELIRRISEKNPNRTFAFLLPPPPTSDFPLDIDYVDLKTVSNPSIIS